MAIDGRGDLDHIERMAFDSSFTEAEFRKQQHAAVARMEKALDSVDPDVIEVEQSSGVLTLKLARGAKIILSAQPSVRQLWLAMAVLGTAIHFDWQNGQWVDDKGQGKELFSTLSQVLREQTGLEISL